MRNHTQYLVEKLFTDPFVKVQKLNISLDLYLSLVLYSLFLLYAKLKSILNKLKLSSRALAFTSHKASLKKKKDAWN